VQMASWLTLRANARGGFAPRVARCVIVAARWRLSVEVGDALLWVGLASEGEGSDRRSPLAR